MAAASLWALDPHGNEGYVWPDRPGPYDSVSNDLGHFRLHHFLRVQFLIQSLESSCKMLLGPRVSD